LEFKNCKNIPSSQIVRKNIFGFISSVLPSHHSIDHFLERMKKIRKETMPKTYINL